jgi:hypothetical protein
MKLICIGLVLLMSLGLNSLCGQTDSELKRLLMYEDQKKEASTAIIFGLLFPGGGSLYADKPEAGILILGTNIGASIWLLNMIKEDPSQDLTLPIVLLASTRVIDLVLAQQGVEDYNRRLRMKLDLPLTMRSDARLKISFIF